ncbi:putative multi antimicrobial extrusion protein [Lupinus albus]|uniref:Protein DETOXIFICATION n=1 Tax=Lupinus albus TaxID=3870 RepID=A0A6A4Q1Y1_LUPAL|nr:putative multi antimicrobial extrusion protein [Lupinus albus]
MEASCGRLFFNSLTLITSQNFILQMKEEIKNLYYIAVPMIITGHLIYGKSAISMHFLGKIGKEALAGGSLAICIANITGYSVISGLASGMDGISSQAFGAQKWILLSQTLQRTIIILILACIPISILWLNFKPFILLYGQNSAITSIAITYLIFSIPDLFFQSIINPLKIFLRTQNLTLALLFSAAVALLVHIPINMIAHGLGLGIRGIALANALTDLNLLIFLLLYLWFSRACSKSWHGWSCQCFKEWKPIVIQAIPSCASVCLEWWWYEILILLSAHLNNAADAVATCGIIVQATSLIYNFHIALSSAVSTRVGNELGANRPLKAKTTSYITLLCAFLTGTMAMVFAFITCNSWGYLFTEDEAILSLVKTSLPIVGVCEIWNASQTAMCGVLRGSVRPSLGALINLVSFYAVGLPFAILMGFVFHYGLSGLFYGLLAAQIVCTIMVVFVVIRTDWNMQAYRARELTNTSNVDREESNEGNEALVSHVLLS